MMYGQKNIKSSLAGMWCLYIHCSQLQLCSAYWQLHLYNVNIYINPYRVRGWSVFTLGEVYERSRVLQTRVWRGIFRHERQEEKKQGTGENCVMNSFVICAVCSSVNVVRMNWHEISWVCVRCTKYWSEYLNWRERFEELSTGGVIILKCILNKRKEWFIVAQDGYQWRTVLNALLKRFGLANPLLASKGGTSCMDFVDC